MLVYSGNPLAPDGWLLAAPLKCRDESSDDCTTPRAPRCSRQFRAWPNRSENQELRHPRSGNPGYQTAAGAGQVCWLPAGGSLRFILLPPRAVSEARSKGRSIVPNQKPAGLVVLMLSKDLSSGYLGSSSFTKRSGRAATFAAVRLNFQLIRCCISHVAGKTASGVTRLCSYDGASSCSSQAPYSGEHADDRRPGPDIRSRAP